jgi:hypothetical protein
MNPSNSIPLCLHCENAPQASAKYRLCERCAGCKGLRNIYRKRRNWTPEWDAHLQKLADRARQRLPLFARNDATELPRRPAPSDRVNRNRCKRIPVRHTLHLGERS